VAAVVNGYIDADDLFAYLGLGAPPSELIDPINDAVNAASRGVDAFCGRRFYTVSSSPRVFRSVGSRVCRIDDAQTITLVEFDAGDDGTFTTDLTGPQWFTEPLNQIGPTGEAWPFTSLRFPSSVTAPTTSHGRPNVRVTAVWGWAAIPSAVRQASLILGAEAFKLREAPFGVAGFAEFGAVRVRDIPQAAKMLQPYTKVEGFA